MRTTQINSKVRREYPYLPRRAFYKNVRSFYLRIAETYRYTGDMRRAQQAQIHANRCQKMIWECYVKIEHSPLTLAEFDALGHMCQFQESGRNLWFSTH